MPGAFIINELLTNSTFFLVGSATYLKLTKFGFPRSIFAIENQFIVSEIHFIWNFVPQGWKLQNLITLIFINVKCYFRMNFTPLCRGCLRRSIIKPASAKNPHESPMSAHTQAPDCHSIANSSLFPTSLYKHSNSTQILALKKMVFLKKKIYFFTFFLCNFSVRTLWCFQKKFKIFFEPE